MTSNIKLPKTINFNTGSVGNPLEVVGLTRPVLKSAMVYNNNSIINLSIFDVEPYDNNPRRSRDAEKWSELKESIRAVGVKKHVQITKRPNSNQYMIATGGNSRLLILRELFEETGDQKFASIPVQEVDFISEDDLLVQHILENEQRADVHFWDKAVAYAKLLQRLGLHGFSLREISEKLTSLGLSLSHNKIGEYLFATNHLYGLGQLCSFLSSYKTIDLRKLFYDLQKSDNLLQPPSESAFSDFWNNQLVFFAANNDCAAELNVKHVSQQIIDAHKALWPIKPDTSDLLVTSISNGGLEQPSIQSVATTIDPLGDEQPNDTITIAARTSNVLKNEQFETTHQNGLIAPYSTHTTATGDIEHPMSVRDNLIKAVEAILEYGNLADTLRIDERFPYQFYVELPALHLNIQPSESQNIRFFIDQRHAEARAIFWFFAELSGQFDDRHESFVMLPNYSPYKRYVVDGVSDKAVNEEFFGLFGMPEFNTVYHWFLYSNEFFINLIQNFFKALRAYGVVDET